MSQGHAPGGAQEGLATGGSNRPPATPSAGVYLTTEEVASLLKCSHKTIDRLIKSGRLPALDIGTGRERNYRIRVEDIEKCLAVPAPLLTRPHRRRRQLLDYPKLV